MKFARARQRRRSVAVDITPMIDVVFLLIIFFMTTAQFAQLTKAEVDLPQAKLAIDMLAMLEAKTQGNLEADEKQMLDAALFELRMRYLDRAK